jgi:hypothetical protein
MNADFFDAHIRHHRDAELLFSSQRWANADHLYGMAAECALKRIMEAFGMPVDSVSGSPSTKADKVHADGIWTRFESYRAGHHLGAAYTLPQPSPFSNWKAEQRYANQSNFDQALAQQHRHGAGLVLRLVKQAQLNGLI